MKRKNAFTMLELIFVIIVIGILSKFGVEILAQSYKSYIATQVNDRFQNQSSAALEFIAKRLQYRIRPSVIVRNDSNFSDFHSLEGMGAQAGYDVLEWIGYDVDGLRAGAWSGIYSKSYVNARLYSQQTNTATEGNLINALSFGNSGFNDSAIFFIGSSSSQDSFGWDGNAINDFTQSMKPVQTDANSSLFAPPAAFADNFTTMDPSVQSLEYNTYQLASTANAIVFDTTNNRLQFCTDYQPWNGQTYNNNGHCYTLMNEVSDFKKRQNKGVITLKVCSVNNTFKDLPEGQFLTCKEKTIL